MTRDPIRDAWHVVARLDEIDPCAVGARLLGEELVVFRSGPGPADIGVTRGRCPHRGTALADAAVQDGTVVCPYHGWRFAADGRCVDIPSLPGGPVPPAAHLAPVASAVRYGLVWANLDPTAQESAIPWYPAPGNAAGLRVISGAPMTWRTSAGRHLENILDLGHFPFVHPSTFGCDEARTVQPHEVEVAPDGTVRASVPVLTRNPDTPDGPLYPALGPVIELGYHYEVVLPYRVTLRFDFPDGMRRALHEVITPVAPDECRIHWTLLVDPRLASPDADELAFAHAVFAEDRPVIESQPPGVPVAATAEVHLPSDRLAVAYRRALRTAGVPPDARV